ncbi:MAG: MFS transporter [Moheibacter sp.]
MPDPENKIPSVWKNKEFRALIFLRFSLIFALFMQSTSVAFEIFRVTQKEIYLGLIGLFEFAPILFTAFYAGQLVDRKDKQKMTARTIGAFMVASFVLMTINFPSVQQRVGTTVYLAVCYLAFFILGLTRAFSTPAVFSLLARVVRRENYEKAIPINSSSFMIGAVTGPLVGGLLLAAVGIEITLAIAFLMMCVSLIAIYRISPKPPEESELSSEETPVQRIKEGLKFIWATPIILAVLSLDMFAVFFGGAESMLPAVVEKVLKAGAVEFGWLRSAHGIGALSMMLILSSVPILRTRVGPKLLGSVAGFGLCIIMFGLSKNFYLSFLILMCGGAFDAVSVIIRQSILQYKTPENLKGRVSSVNSIFVSSSNELGAFESGVAASLLGLVPSIIFGGAMTIVVVIVIALKIKAVRHVRLE